MNTRRSSSSGSRSASPDSYRDFLLGEQERGSTHARPYWYGSPKSKKRRYLYIAGGVVVLVVLSLLILQSWAPLPLPFSTSIAPTVTTPKDQSTRLESYVNGPPTTKFRDNLKPELKYITSWLDAGWTNDVITYMNLLYLATVTERIPVIGMFIPSHIGFEVESIDFGKVFDVPRLSKALNIPVLEWHEVKDRNSTETDELGCWNVWEAVQDREHKPRPSRLVDRLKLDISYTKAPTWVKILPNYEHDLHSSFFSLASLGFPEVRAESLVPPLESPINHARLPPDEHMLCYDYLYYTCSSHPFEFEYDFSPAWRFVGQHMRWAPELEKLADQYVRKAIGLSESDGPTPAYIAIHARHSDFKVWCEGDPFDGCFGTIPAISRRVEEVRQELREKKGLEIQHVIMTSDERNSTWWDQVREQGWLVLDHSHTVEDHGIWYPLLIDATIQSNGEGFIGTDHSTVSVVARRRVQSWRNGATRTVKWGNAHADDHRRRREFFI
ncbi:hypothetical protein AMATHDRAFT_146793 [Amanita thiersii Skay4041]|uniref:Uncharacterized protein n=1 Tax=Amanita thiersii Skay4041 TaxID=703135 RepID=A0A2A9NQ50_9AGAR|nr:hypothetical protein AMATHDRAFT_146793 [Amanita thiersii Skay4041]